MDEKFLKSSLRQQDHYQASEVRQRLITVPSIDATDYHQ
jgi:hypothetical protein